MIQTYVTMLPSNENEIVDDLKQFFHRKRQEGINNLIDDQDKCRTMIGELFAKFLLSGILDISPQEVTFQYTKQNKPLLKYHDDLFFNIAHSGKYVIVSIANTQIGCDIEKVISIDYNAASTFMSNEEHGYFLKLHPNFKKDYYFRLWTIKESYIKATGLGFTEELSSLTCTIYKESITIYRNNMLINDYFFKEFQEIDNYKVSVCCQGQTNFNNMIKFNPIRIEKDSFSFEN